MGAVKKKYRFPMQSIILIFLCIACLFSFISPQIVFNSSAEETYSTVLSDLQKDPNFNVEDYPVVEYDYSLDVITIAEGSDLNKNEWTKMLISVHDLLKAFNKGLKDGLGV